LEFLQEDLPLSSLQVQDGVLLARFYNPTDLTAHLSRAYPETDVWGEVKGDCDSVPPKKIVTLQLDRFVREISKAETASTSRVSILNLPQWRVGPNHSAPDPAVLSHLEEKIRLLDEQLEQITLSLAQIRNSGETDSRSRLRLEHNQAALQRERLEYRLSVLLNRRKLDFGGNSPPEALEKVDPEIAAVGKELNGLRIKRRIYDYVVQAVD
jgi:hypothetical protein